MNTGPDHREPSQELDAHERDLAARLSRVGPFDGPPPALDAKILAAAHAAAVRRPRQQRRWMAWMGVPPAMITGVGVAAAAVLALGLVWQMRPAPTMAPAADESAGAEEEVFIIAEPASAARPAHTNPPPFPAEAQPGAAPRVAQAPADAAATARADSSAARAAADKQAAAVAAAVEAAPVAQAAPPPAPHAPSAPANVAAEAKSDAPGSADGFVAEPQADTSAQIARTRHETYTSAARAKAERRGYAKAIAEDAPAAAAAPAPMRERDSAELDAATVTGSRLQRVDDQALVVWSDVPAGNDRQLAPDEWLERIRLRRSQGDTSGARESLRLFRQEHPRVRIPDDLRGLLGGNAQR